jgi:hypothetical protein
VVHFHQLILQIFEAFYLKIFSSNTGTEDYTRTSSMNVNTSIDHRRSRVRYSPFRSSVEALYSPRFQTVATRYLSFISIQAGGDGLPHSVAVLWSFIAYLMVCYSPLCYEYWISRFIEDTNYWILVRSHRFRRRRHATSRGHTPLRRVVTVLYSLNICLHLDLCCET